jgi:hypothetical protein
MEETSPHGGIKMTILFAGKDSHVHQTAQPGKMHGALQQLSTCYCREALYLYQRNAKQDSTNVVCTSCVGK